jgi:type III restriction enzyme
MLVADLKGSSVEFEYAPVLSEAEVDKILEIEIAAVWKYVFNTNSAGELEVRRNPKDKQELSFRVKSSANSAVFALIKIGDTKEFEKNNLQGFNIENDFDKKVTIFENLNQSSVNILMGSRAFYEGWDSNRPNIINLINIGVGNDASKFILQSVGRGIRIEPIKNQRKRLEGLINDELVSVAADLVNNRENVKPIETLFVFSTNYKAISRILNTLKTIQGEEEHILPMFEKFVHSCPLFIPVYKKITDKVEQESKRLKLKIHEQDFEIFDNLMKDVDRGVLALNYYLSYQDIAILVEKHSQHKSYFKQTGEERIGKIEPILKRILSYYKTIPEKFDTFALVKDEDIRHYQQIKVRVSENKSRTTVDFAGFEDLKKR